MSRIVALVTDFGVGDPYAGQMEAVIADAADGVHVIHLCHGVPPQNVAVGALVVAAGAPLLPPGGVIVGVVDPGVGGSRRGLIVRAGGRWLVGPDNGLLLAGEAPDGVWALDRPAYWRPDPAPTFHGRDVFAPVAAQLAGYVRPDAMGTPIEDAAASPVELAVTEAGALDGKVIYVDRFGNLVTNIPADAARATHGLTIEIAHVQIRDIRPTYGTGDAPIGLIGSWNLLEIAIPGGSAADRLGAEPGTPLRVHP